MISVGIVEDSRVFRNSLKEQLSANSHTTVAVVAANGREFLEKMKELPKEQRPSAVLMDIAMPEFNGIDTITVAKELYPDIHFIILTSFDEDDKIFDAIRAGASGYLLKEERMENIVQALITADEGAPMSPRIARKTIALLKDAPPPPPAAKEEDNYSLTDREMEILKLIVEGNNYNQIAEKLFISPLTVKKHIKNIYRKLQVNSKLSAVKVAMKKGWFRN